jgi:DNA-binding FadR family transcriptional regulator
MTSERPDPIGRLRALVAETTLAPGARLPAERELAHRLQVTRNTLRKALATLEAEGLIWRHVGRGTFVGARPRSSGLEVAQLARSASPMEIVEARMTVEPQLARLAAARASLEEIEEMQLCVRRNATAEDTRTFERWDSRLHHAIAKASHNRLLVMLFEALDTTREGPAWGRAKEATLTAAAKREYVRQHDDIVHAILDRDGPTAERRMRDHLSHLRHDLAEFSGVGRQA